MRTILTIFLTAALLTTALPALADHDGRPHGDEKCHKGADGRNGDCTQLPAGNMSCLPEAGIANDLAVVVGSADSGTYQVRAVGVNHDDSNSMCFFEVRVDASAIRFNEGYAPGILAPYGGASDAGATPCLTAPGESCEPTASFTWWRAVHGVTFDVPFELYVNGMLVDQGEVHYYDPPMFEDLYGGALVL